ncbi:hypothetical protein RIF29_23409 [Crotalaria pallida]|uniref:Uncharacterized protein n=1 Tax=Crotalaria pallida TaxID=3830 RepID=A0AAN9I9Y1_CROPI
MKKQWVEKKKVAPVEEQKNEAGSTKEAEIIEIDDSAASTSKIEEKSESATGTVIAETVSEKHEDPNEEVNQKDSSTADYGKLQADKHDNERAEKEQAWTTIQTRSKASNRSMSNKEKSPLKGNQASKAYG